MNDPKIPAEYVGRARDFMRRSKLEYDVAGKLSCQLLEPIVARYERYPLRNQRPELIDTLVRQWSGLPSKFMMHRGIVRKKPTQLEIFEIRVTKSNLYHADWPTEFEANLCITNVLLNIGSEQIGKRVKFKPLSFVVSHILSQHALARRYQRYPQQVTDEDILADIRCLLEIQPDKQLAEKSVVVANDRGEWRGAHKVIQVGDNKSVAAIMVRTWI